MKIVQLDPYGFGLVVSDDVPIGSDLIALPHHVPLRFSENVEGVGFESVLDDLGRRIPGMCVLEFVCVQMWLLYLIKLGCISIIYEHVFCQEFLDLVCSKFNKYIVLR